MKKLFVVFAIAVMATVAQVVHTGVVIQEGGHLKPQCSQGDWLVFSGDPSGNLVFVSGQIPIDPKTNQLVTNAATVYRGSLRARICH